MKARVSPTDVQGQRSAHPLPLARVGITHLDYPVRIRRGGYTRDIILRMELAVDLPESQRGAHMSRFMEKIEKEFTVPREVGGIEDLAREIAEAQLSIHTYATRARVSLSGKVELEGKVHTLYGRYDTGTGKKMVGLRVLGAIACPCAIKLTGGLSHNQRAELTVEMEVDSRKVDAEDLVKICEESFSAPVQLLLKRPDEKAMVERMHANPRFVEDTVRECVTHLSARYPGASCRVRCVSYESIHPYDVFAEWKGVLRSGAKSKV